MRLDKQTHKSLWRNRDFVLLFGGQAVSVLGTRISSLALPLLVLATTHSAAQAGFITSARMAPYLILGLPAGVLIDRCNRKSAMIICDVARCVALGSVPLAWAFWRLTLVQLYIVALIQGTAFVFFNVAEMASLPNVVASDDLAQATALDSAAGSAGSLLGPGLAGLIIGAAKSLPEGAVLAYLADAVTYLLSVVSLTFIRVPFQARHARDEVSESLSLQVKEGLRFLWRDKPLRTLAVTSWALSFLFAPVPLAMIVLARDAFHAGASMIGMIFSLSAVGGLIGAAIAPRLRGRLPFGWVIIGAVAVQAMVTPLVGLAVSPAMMIAGWSLAFMVDPVFSMASTSYRLAVTPDEMRGRVHSIYRMGGYGAEPLGTALGGLLLGMIGPRNEILIAAAGVGVCAVAVSVTRIRTTPWPGPQEEGALPHSPERLERPRSRVRLVSHTKEPQTRRRIHETHTHLHSPGLHHRHGHKS